MPADIAAGTGPGVFDLAGPLFAAVDGALAFVPAWLRLVLWGAIAAAISMGLYKLLSPQRRIASAKRAAFHARQALDAHEGAIADAWPLMRRAVGAALYPLRLELFPALVASLPVIFVVVWLSSAYGYSFPPLDRALPARVTPPEYIAWMAPQREAEPGAPGFRVFILDPSGRTADLPIEEPVPVLEKRRWWNLLAGNPAGYLPERSPVERVELPLPQQEFLPVGPSWMRGWAVTFFAALILSSFAAKRIWRVA